MKHDLSLNNRQDRDSELSQSPAVVEQPVQAEKFIQGLVAKVRNSSAFKAVVALAAMTAGQSFAEPAAAIKAPTSSIVKEAGTPTSEPTEPAKKSEPVGPMPMKEGEKEPSEKDMKESGKKEAKENLPPPYITSPLRQPVAPFKEIPWKPSNGFGASYNFRGRQEIHLGEDMKLPPGTIVSSIADGMVLVLDYVDGTGGLVILQHDLGQGESFCSTYMHVVYNTDLRRGMRIKQGTPIGRVAVANSPQGGYNTADHVHVQCNFNQSRQLAQYVTQKQYLWGIAKSTAPDRIMDCFGLTEALAQKDAKEAILKRTLLLRNGR